ncbi:ATP-binding SpoIIE family protein phosphatase [Asticcacaulis sp. YBE204]|uniref:ATP-binding SpoIIE family protein phosphatase n=1 Tax=Asticcacaulis sp. YBE204 TaxID=1282363 RepID=UPI0003C3FC16|nr:ATP-binding SpoIIE family protein phosphatase [Asticcacaulis sp. YBE204]ESQ79018.1 hypothetical protein AEYBE204_11380 [Asticcacaulis sp. YBE204]
MEIDLFRQSLAITVKQQHDVGDARRQAMNAGKNLSFDETVNGRVGIVATELAGNLAKHAGGGTIILRAVRAGEARGLEIMSLDDGPGMDLQRCFEDGYSTAGSPGTGLGAVKRLADRLETYSLHGKGSVLVAQVFTPPTEMQALKPEAYDIGAICLPVVGERLCGDGWRVRERENGVDIVVSDGLGHGPLAAEASDVALDTFDRKPGQDAQGLLEALNAAMRPTRGAAVMTASLDAAQGRLTSAGIGNIAGYVMTVPKAKGLVSMNGIVGHSNARVKAFSTDCGPNDVLIFHSDGLTTHWKLEEFPGLAHRAPSVIAGVMYKHFQRGRDDATVVVVIRRA